MDMKSLKGNKPLWIGIGALGFVVVCVGIYFLFFFNKGEKPSVVAGEKKEEAAEVQEVEKPLPLERVSSSINWDTVELDQSDQTVREAVKNVTSNPQVETWLQKPNLVRKFVGATDNIVDGLSPRSFVSFMTPKGRFEVYEKSGSLCLDPDSYKRYNQIADVAESLSADACIRLFHEMKPLVQEAYKQLGYPNKDFNNTLSLAVIELLKTPVIEGDIMLSKRVISYKMVDPKLEQLSPAQKHLLRMGPRNVRKIQTKLREVARTLGIPESRIPKPSAYVPSNK